MLRRVNEPVDPSGATVRIKEAGFPAPFLSELEFNSPVHGNWNIVHTGMLLPDSIQIYVCADNCMRGVVLTAAEMNAADRFSFVILREENLLNDNLEEITIEGVSDVLQKRKDHPRAVLVFTVCLHHFLGCDLDRVYEELERRFPDTFFVRCYMDPIMQKAGLTPEQKLRKAIYDALVPGREVTRSAAVLGSDFALDDTSDIRRLLSKNGYMLAELPGCKSWEEYLQLSRSRLFLCTYPAGQYGAGKQAERLSKEYLYLPSCFGYEEIAGYLKQLTEVLELAPLDIEAEIAACEAALHQAREVISDTVIVLDSLLHPRPLGLARLLISHGFSVRTVYLDGISREEQEDFDWLSQHAPDLELAATIQVKMRILPRTHSEKILALGQKAAWFNQTGYFVNMVQGAGLWGFDGIRRLCSLMIEACEEEKDTRDLVVRKGWGCESCI